MRKLKAPDVFAALRVVAAFSEKDKITEVVKKIVADADKKVKAAQAAEAASADGAAPAEPSDQNDDFAVTLGIEATFKLLELATGTRAEAKIYEFLAGPFEMTAAEVEAMDAVPFMQAVGEVAKQNDLAGFFGSVLELRRKM